jgi:hypothetical protein
MKGSIMKIMFGILISGLAITTSRAQWIVYDPAAHTQQIIDEAQNIAKYIEMINNQVQQINTLSSQLQQLQNYNQAFGNPATLLNIAGVNVLVDDLARTPVGHTIEQIQSAARGTEAMTYNAGGLYHSIGVSFTTPDGAQVQREETTYRNNAAVQRAVQNYTNVVDDVLNRRRTLKSDIAATTEKLQSATTASEVQKLTGVLIGLNADLAATDKEIDHATSLTLVQDAENRSDADKQIKARQEERAAEFTQSLKNYGTTFAPDISPPVFPEK